MTKDEMKDKISMALKDLILRQGFEIICKENAELRNIAEFQQSSNMNRYFENKKLKDENAGLKEKLNIRSCQNCKHNNKSCPNDGSCVHYNKWEDYKNPQFTKAKAIIKDLLSVLPKENIEGVYETVEAAEQFLREEN